MLKDDELIGAIAIYRQEVRPFTDKQIELVQNFAAQAVIAIENTRLLNELRSDDDLRSLEQQTATTEVLKVISSSPGELKPVFNAMLENATRICEAKFGITARFTTAIVSDRVATVGAPPALVEFMRQQTIVPAGRGTISTGSYSQTKQVVHIADDAGTIPTSPATSGQACRRAFALCSACRCSRKTN